MTSDRKLGRTGKDREDGANGRRIEKIGIERGEQRRE